jgi:NagD protein
MNDVNPEYVVVGETHSYNYESISKAVHFVNNGARLIATNPDVTAPGETGIVPACGALVKPIEVATGKSAYYIGKPNALMMRTGLKMLGVHSADAVMVGDRMDTDILAGIESGMETVLVLSGVSTRETVKLYPFRPRYILDGVGNIPPGEDG